MKKKTTLILTNQNEKLKKIFDSLNKQIKNNLANLLKSNIKKVAIKKLSRDYNIKTGSLLQIKNTFSISVKDDELEKYSYSGFYNRLVLKNDSFIITSKIDIDFIKENDIIPDIKIWLKIIYNNKTYYIDYLQFLNCLDVNFIVKLT